MSYEGPSYTLTFQGSFSSFWSRDVEDEDMFLGSHRAAQFVNRYIPWFTRELADLERFFMGDLDVSVSLHTLKKDTLELMLS